MSVTFSTVYVIDRYVQSRLLLGLPTFPFLEEAVVVPFEFGIEVELGAGEEIPFFKSYNN
jgi:hypothetical protein